MPLLTAGLLAIVLIAWGLWPLAQQMLEPTRPASETLRAQQPTAPAALERMPAVEQAVDEPAAAEPPPLDAAPSDEAAKTTEAEAHGEQAAAPSGDLEHYAKRPMSAVPHRVMRAWGASEENRRLGLVGAYLVVEPGISETQLTRLCRDIYKYHRDAKAVSVRILDSEEAATYDHHVDGGLLRNQHEVASVSSDPKLGVREIRVRGNLVKP